MSAPPAAARHCLPAGSVMLRDCGTVLLALLMVACAPLPVVPSGKPTDELPPLAAGLPADTAPTSETLNAAFADREITLSCGQSVTAAAWRSVCVNALGLRVFTLAIGSDGQVTAERGTGVPEALDARRVLADVQLASWPLAALETAFAGSHWRVQQASKDTRRLWLDGRLAAEVHYASPALWARAALAGQPSTGIYLVHQPRRPRHRNTMTVTKTTRTPAPVDALLPHSGPLRLVDTLLDYDAESVKVALTVRAAAPFGDGAGRVPAYVGLEYMAQAISVFSGLDLHSAGQPPKIGLLIGTRRFHAQVPHFEDGAKLVVIAVRVLGGDDLIWVFECTLTDETGAELASAQVKVHQPENIRDFLRAC